MASAITHFIVGASLALPALESRPLLNALPGWRIPVSAGLFAVAADLDTFVMGALRIPYDSFFGHRGFFHSPFFLALFFTGMAAIAARGHRRSAVPLAALWTGCAVTHPLLDMLTDGGLGVMLLFPFSEERLFFPFTPIHVSPFGILQFFRRAGYILASEAPFCAAALFLGSAGLLARRRVVRRN
ncbi:MAG TPA: metal-dependent hydrolase [Bryobacteraceae bacterium]|nr:metal-dependent hydrolase [Bryobacteraceae bacterium]